MVQLIIADQEGMMRIERNQRDALIERGLIYYCEDHSTADQPVYHPERGKDWTDISVVLAEQSQEKEKNGE